MRQGFMVEPVVVNQNQHDLVEGDKHAKNFHALELAEHATVMPTEPLPTLAISSSAVVKKPISGKLLFFVTFVAVYLASTAAGIALVAK